MFGDERFYSAHKTLAYSEEKGATSSCIFIQDLALGFPKCAQFSVGMTFGGPVGGRLEGWQAAQPAVFK